MAKKKLKELPTPVLLNYYFNNTTIRYEVKSKPPGFNYLPDELIKCKSQKETIKQFSEYVIQSPTINGVKTFHTSLERVSNYTNVFIGDDRYHKEDKNLIVFIFSPSFSRLIISYFPDYYPETIKRKKEIIRNYIKRIENE